MFSRPQIVWQWYVIESSPECRTFQLTSIAKTAITRLLGRAVGIVAAIFINIVVAGTLLGTSFVASRMAVAAANKGWLPQPFAVIGRVGLKPKPAESEDIAKDETTGVLDAPINAVIMSVILGAVFILFGNFRDLLTITGLGEYTFFMLAVIGAAILRRREPDLHRPYKANVIVPFIFIVVSGFVVVRGAVFAPYLAAVIVAIWIVGLVYYWIRKRWASGLSEAGVDDTSSL
jgi:amino acid transporter